VTQRPAASGVGTVQSTFRSPYVADRKETMASRSQQLLFELASTPQEYLEDVIE